MMKTKLPIILLLLAYNLPRCQTRTTALQSIMATEAIKMEGITYSGSRIIGIYKTRNEAMQVAKNYQQSHQNTKASLVYKSIKPSHIEFDPTEKKDVFTMFREGSPKGYALLSPEQYNALSILTKDTFPAARWYLMKTKNIPEGKATEQLNKLKQKYYAYIE